MSYLGEVASELVSQRGSVEVFIISQLNMIAQYCIKLKVWRAWDVGPVVASSGQG